MLKCDIYASLLKYVRKGVMPVRSWIHWRSTADVSEVSARRLEVWRGNSIDRAETWSVERACRCAQPNGGAPDLATCTQPCLDKCHGQSQRQWLTATLKLKSIATMSVTRLRCRWTDLGPVRDGYSWEPKAHCIRRGSRSPYGEGVRCGLCQSTFSSCLTPYYFCKES